MNTRSLKFQLLGWYAGLLIGLLALLGASTYLALRSSLVRALRENQYRRARQIAELVQQQVDQKTPDQIGHEVELRYAPAINERFVRISRRDGIRVYLSPTPTSQGFDPVAVPPPVWPEGTETDWQAPLAGGRKLLLTAHQLKLSTGDRFLVETGALMDGVQADLKKWLLFLATMLPVVLLIAVGGGFVLVKRALSSVDRITASAERISSQNLSERLPLAHTGDELERLSVSLNRMIERLDSAFNYSRRFVADASHELRTPLAVLQGELQSLTEQAQWTPEWRDRVGSALEEVARLGHIVEGLFAISRLDAGEATAEWVALDLAQLAVATADQMSLLAEDKGIKVTCEPAEGVWVAGDRARLKQVIVNLLDNAIKYTLPHRAITVTVRTEGSCAVLEVADTGIGIPAEALPRIFERFFRVDYARSRDQGGAGLGLSIVKAICAAHSGRVFATSEPGRGSRFRIELPSVSSPSNNHIHAKLHDH